MSHTIRIVFRCARAVSRSKLLFSPALKNLLTGDIPPNRVIEKNLDTIANYNVLQRDDSMVLYSPPIAIDEKGSKKKTPPIPYEIVLFRPASESVNSSYRCVITLKPSVLCIFDNVLLLVCFGHKHRRKRCRSLRRSRTEFRTSCIWSKRCTTFPVS